MGINLYTFSRIIVENIIRNDFQCTANEVPSDKFLSEIVSGKCLCHLTKGNQPIFLWKTRVSFSLPAMDARNTKVNFMYCYSNSVSLLAVAFNTLISLFLPYEISVLMILNFGKC